MFGKWGANLKRVGKGSHGAKYRLEVQVVQVKGLPSAVKKCRVVWSRAAKLQMTDVKEVKANGSVSYKQTLVQVATMFKDKTGALEEKDYEFKIQVPGRAATDAPISVGKATLDMAKFCGEQNETKNHLLPVTVKVGSTTYPKVYVELIVTSVFLADADDGMTETSGITGLTSRQGSGIKEQDLDGFDEDNAKFLKKSSSGKARSGDSGEASGSRSKRATPPIKEEDTDDEEEAARPAAASAAARRKPPSGAGASSGKASTSRAAPVAEIEEGDDDDDDDDNPFAKKVPQRAARPAAKRVIDDDEDISPLSSGPEDESDDEPVRRKQPEKDKGGLLGWAKKKGKEDEPAPTPAFKPAEPEPELSDLKSALFATKKDPAPASKSKAGASSSSGGGAGPSGSSSKAKAAAPKPADSEEEEAAEDDMRNALFAVKKPAAKPAPAPAAASKSASGKGKAAPPPPDSDDEPKEEDEDNLRAALFAKPATAAKPAAAKAAPAKAKPAPPPDSEGSEDEEDEDEYARKPSSSSAQPPKRPGAAGAAAAAGAGAAAKAKSAGAAAAGGSSDAQALKAQVAELQAQLAKEQKDKEALQQRLDEGDDGDMYSQLKEMEETNRKEISDLMEKHLADVEEMEESHAGEVRELKGRIKELEAALAAAGAAGGAKGGLSADEIEEREAELQALQAAVKKAKAAADARMAEADRMVDQSLMVATKNQQEKKALQEEIALLKERLEDAGRYDRDTAVRAVVSSQDHEEELEELREQVEELQAKNDQLQKMSEDAAREAGALLDGVRSLLADEEANVHLEAAGPLAELAASTNLLCQAYKDKSAFLNTIQNRLQDQSSQLIAMRSDNSASLSALASAAAGPGTTAVLTASPTPASPSPSAYSYSTLTPEYEPEKPTRPHELLARVQELSGQASSLQARVDELGDERTTLKDRVMAQAQALDSLQARYDALASEQAQLQARASALLGPEDPAMMAMGIGMSGADVAAAASHDATWSALEALVGRLRSERAELRQRAADLQEERIKLHAELDAARLQLEQQQQVPVPDPRRSSVDLSAHQQHLRRSMDMHSQGQSRTLSARSSIDAGAATGAGGASPSGAASAAASAAAAARIAELEGQVITLQANLDELAEADSIIREWSDYATSISDEKEALQRQVEELRAQLAGAGISAHHAAGAAGAGPYASPGPAGSSAGGPGAHGDARARRVSVASSAADSTAGGVEGDDGSIGGEEEDASPTSLGAGSSIASPRTWSARIASLQARNRALERQVEELQAGLARLSAPGAASAGGHGGGDSDGAAAQAASLQAQLAQTLAEKAQLAASVEALQAELEQAPLIASLVGADGAGYSSPVPAGNGARSRAGGATSRTPHSSHLAPVPMGQLGGLAGHSASKRPRVEEEQSSRGAAAYDRHHDDDSDAPSSPMSSDISAAHAPAESEEEEALLRAAPSDADMGDATSSLAAAAAYSTAGASAAAEAAAAAFSSQAYNPLHESPSAEHAHAATAAGYGGVGAVGPHQQPALSRGGFVSRHPPNIGAGYGHDATHPSSSARAAEAMTGHEVAAQERAVLSATVYSLRIEVQRLQEDKAQLAGQLERLAGEHEALQRAARASAASVAPVASLAEGISSSAAASPSTSPSRRPPSISQLSQQQPSSLARRVSFNEQAAAVASSAAAASVAEATPSVPLAPVLACARSLLLLLEAPPEELERADADFDSAMGALKARVEMLAEEASELRAANDKLDDKLGRAHWRVDELEALLEDAQVENQNLTEQLEEYLTAGPGSAGSVAEESVASPGGFGGGHGPAASTARSIGGAASGHAGAMGYSYGGEASLSMSALEQRLTLAEARRDELSTALEEANRQAKGLSSQLRASQEALATAEDDVEHRESELHAVFQRYAAVCSTPPEEVLGAALYAKVASSSASASARSKAPSASGAKKGGYSFSDEEDDGEDELYAKPSSSNKDPAMLQRELAKAQKSLGELQAANAKLESICTDLEDKLRDARGKCEDLEQRLKAANVTAAAVGVARALEGGGASSGGVDLQKRVGELEAKLARLARENESLEDQLAEEQDARKELEDGMKQQLADAGDDEAQETVAAFEVKYTRLKERYKMLEESTQEELDELTEQLGEAQGQVAAAQRQIKDLQAQVAKGTAGAAAGALAAAGRGPAPGPGFNPREMDQLKRENEMILSQLLTKQLELAEMAETVVIMKRDLARARETNLKLAQKLTTLEAQAYSGKGKKGKGPPPPQYELPQ